MARFFFVLCFCALGSAALADKLHSSWQDPRDRFNRLVERYCVGDRAATQEFYDAWEDRFEGSKSEAVMAYLIGWFSNPDNNCPVVTGAAEERLRIWANNTRLSAEAGYPVAKKVYGDFLMEGFVSPGGAVLIYADPDLGLAYLRSAALTGYAPAATTLAYYYRKGGAIPQDVEMAEMYLVRATELGASNAAVERERAALRGLSVEIDFDVKARRLMGGWRLGKTGTYLESNQEGFGVFTDYRANGTKAGYDFILDAGTCLTDWRKGIGEYSIRLTRRGPGTKAFPEETCGELRFEDVDTIWIDFEGNFNGLSTYEVKRQPMPPKRR